MNSYFLRTKKPEANAGRRLRTHESEKTDSKTLSLVYSNMLTTVAAAAEELYFRSGFTMILVCKIVPEASGDMRMPAPGLIHRIINFVSKNYLQSPAQAKSGWETRDVRRIPNGITN